MNTKFPFLTLALVLLAILFVPLIADDGEMKCKAISDGQGGQEQVCDDSVGYISVYTKYFTK